MRLSSGGVEREEGGGGGGGVEVGVGWGPGWCGGEAA
jgi:hypothetical protein